MKPRNLSLVYGVVAFILLSHSCANQPDNVAGCISIAFKQENY